MVDAGRSWFIVIGGASPFFGKFPLVGWLYGYGFEKVDPKTGRIPSNDQMSDLFPCHHGTSAWLPTNAIALTAGTGSTELWIEQCSE